MSTWPLWKPCAPIGPWGPSWSPHHRYHWHLLQPHLGCVRVCFCLSVCGISSNLTWGVYVCLSVCGISSNLTWGTCVCLSVCLCSGWAGQWWAMFPAGYLVLGCLVTDWPFTLIYRQCLLGM